MNKTILVVDDEIPILTVLEIGLQHYGFNVICVNNPVDGIEEAKKSNVDIILTDIDMIEMNGKQMGISILKSKPDIRILYMSGCELKEIEARGILNYKDNFIQKPFGIRDDLVPKIKEVLSSP